MALDLQDGWWYNGTSHTDRPYILDYGTLEHSSPREFWLADPPWWRWGTYRVWRDHGMAILFVNQTKEDLKITSTAIKSVSCNSNGRAIIAYSSTRGYYALGDTANGAGCDFQCYYRSCNDAKTSNVAGMTPQQVVDLLNSDDHIWKQSDTVSVQVPEVDFDNMNVQGRAGSGPSSVFGGKSTYPERGRFIAREYQFQESPVIEANGGICTLHIDVHVENERTSFPGVPFIQCSMDPHEMEIVFEPERGPYIWRMTNGRWVLKRPLNIMTSSGWSDIEDIGG